MNQFMSLLRTYQDEFNLMRRLVDVGKRIAIIMPYLDKVEYQAVLEKYNKCDIDGLNSWVKGKEQNDNENS